MSADYARMERHLRYRKVGWALVIFSGIAMLPEGAIALNYHFPAWDDYALVVTTVTLWFGRLILRRTAMYVTYDS